ncbi:MAG: molybdenum cofactor guanylyltransferase [Actinomycetota bacterium]
MQPAHPAGLLLTGGASRRMRRDKATIDFGGVPLAVRVARALAQVAYPVLAVGIEAGTGLPVVDDPREGPLVAFVRGAEALRARGHDGPILLCACDIPFIEPALLAHIAASVEGFDAAIPFVRGREQPLAACYAPSAVGIARWLVTDEADAMRDLMRLLNVNRLLEETWDHIAPSWSLVDLDTPGALLRAKRILRGPA